MFEFTEGIVKMKFISSELGSRCLSEQDVMDTELLGEISIMANIMYHVLFNKYSQEYMFFFKF